MSSVAPQARKNFIAIITPVLPDDTTIAFGKRLPMLTAPLTLQITGWTATVAPAELSPAYHMEEAFDLDCVLSSFQGDQDWDAREQEVMTAFALITTTVANNYTLAVPPASPGANTGPVRWAYPTDYQFIPDVDVEHGMSIGTLDFKIHCEQRIETLT